MMTHTPGPWSTEMHAIRNPDGLERGHGIYGDQHLIAEIHLSAENAAHAYADAKHIVHCVNTHASLVNALEKATDWLQEAIDNEPEDYENSDLLAALNEARQALNAAKGAPENETDWNGYSE